MPFEPFQNFITRAAQSYGVKTELSAANICQQFRNIIPEVFQNKPEPGDHISPAHFKDSTLTINVENQAWAQEVIMRKEKIIEELNRKAGKEIIKKIATQLARQNEPSA